MSDELRMRTWLPRNIRNWLEWQEYEANHDAPRTFIGGAGHPPSRETGVEE